MFTLPANPEIPMTPAHFTAGRKGPSTQVGLTNIYSAFLLSSNPNLILSPLVPNRSSQKLVNIFGGKCQHHDVLRDLRFLSPGLRCSGALICPVCRTTACKQGPGHQGCQTSQWENRGVIGKDTFLITVESLSQAI